LWPRWGRRSLLHDRSSDEYSIRYEHGDPHKRGGVDQYCRQHERHRGQQSRGQHQSGVASKAIAGTNAVATTNAVDANTTVVTTTVADHDHDDLPDESGGCHQHADQHNLVIATNMVVRNEHGSVYKRCGGSSVGARHQQRISDQPFHPVVASAWLARTTGSQRQRLCQRSYQRGFFTWSRKPRKSPPPNEHGCSITLTVSRKHCTVPTSAIHQRLRQLH